MFKVSDNISLHRQYFHSFSRHFTRTIGQKRWSCHFFESLFKWGRWCCFIFRYFVQLCGFPNLSNCLFSRLITIHLTVHFIEQCPPGFHTLLCFRLMPQMLISLSLPRTRLCCQCGFDPFISHLIPMLVGYKEGKTLNFGKNKKNITFSMLS